MELLLVYLWLKLDGFITLVGILTAGLTLLAVARVFFVFDKTDNLEKEYHPENYKQYFPKRKTLWKWAIAPTVTLIVAFLLPSSKDVAILVGTSVAVDVVKSPEGAKISQLLRGKANEILDEQLEKLKPAKAASAP